MASRSGSRVSKTLGNSDVEDDDTGNIGYDLEDLDDSREARRLSNQSDSSRRNSREQDDVEFHGPWVKAVTPKGDAFYLEKDSSLRRPNGSYPESHRPRSTKTKSRRSKSSIDNSDYNDPIMPNGFGSGSTKKVTFSDTGIVKTIFVPLRSRLSDYQKHGSECERLLGIIPGYFPSSGSRNGDVSNGKRIVVQGLLPRGSALKAGVEIGDWLMSVDDTEVNADNVDDVLLAIASDKKAKLTLQRVAMETHSQPKPQQRRRLSEDADGLVKLVAGERLLPENRSSFRDVPHGALYLALDISSDDLVDKEDVIYCSPGTQNKSLLDLRGAFVTLGQMIPDVTDNSAKNSSAVIGDQLVHVAYCTLNRRIFLLFLPAHKVSISQLNHVMRDMSRVLLIIYGSIDAAFEQLENHLELDRFFALVFQRLLQAQSRQEFLEPFALALSGMRAVLLPEPVKMLIHNCLSEFEAADFADMAESYYDVRRSYTILGSCLYYKGYLLASHLQKDDAIDVNLYLRYHGLLTLSNEEELGHLVVWREVFPTSRFRCSPRPVIPSYTETDGRWFMLVVGMRNAVLGVLLEAGGCAEKAEGHPTPDPFYIDQANATLLQLQTLDIFGECELRLEGPPVPSLSCVDWFISAKGDKGYQQAQAAAFMQPPKLKKTREKSILKPRSSIASSASLTQLNKQERYSAKESGERFSSESDLRYDSNQLEDDYFSSDSSNEPDRTSAQTVIGSNEMLTTSSGSRLFKGPKPSHNLLSMYDISDLKRNPEDIGSEEAGSLVKLTSGYQNTLFHYVLMDGLDGIYVCPSQQELRQVTSPTHDVVMRHFDAASLEIHRLFERSALQACHSTKSKSHGRFSTGEAVLGQVKEYGMCFNCPLIQSTDTKKQPASTTYWVVGRLFESPVPSEFYVCFHDSAQQNLVEMAFKLMQGTLI